MRLRSLAAGLLFLSCAHAPEVATPRTGVLSPHPEERHLGELRQLTFAGENAEAYWSFAGDQLIFQSSRPGEGCDRIRRLRLSDGVESQVSSGEGATTCAYFLPGDEEVVYASTHLGGPECPPKPDMSLGYVWALYESYDIFRAKADGSALRRLTETPGYDAEATVCAKDGSIVFTSVRDGDLELYRMDADGGNVRRLTSTPGYDGGAFFSADCSKLVWRASRPKEGKELDEYRALLAQGLIRPNKLELYVANADGSDPRQVTYLNAATFAPFFFPDGRRLIFSSNVGDPRGREFDLWAIDVDGSNLERITHTPGFDGFPVFSPDGKYLAFGSNRANAPGSRDTNVFVAKWIDETPVFAEPSAADRLMSDVRWLAAPERQGRGLDTGGLEAAGKWLEARFAELGLTAAGDAGTYRNTFEVTTALSVEDATSLSIGKQQVDASAFVPLGFSSSAKVRGPLVLVGHGIVAKDLKWDDYAGKDVRGKIAVVRRFTPDADPFGSPERKRRYGDLRQKAWHARERGAVGMIVVDAPETSGAADSEAPLPKLQPEGFGDAGLPVIAVKRAVLADVLPRLERKQRVEAALEVALSPKKSAAFNVVGRIAAGAPEGERLPGHVVIGAHYDHLGLGGHGSLAPGRTEPHLGADDNASGVAGLLEAARRLLATRETLKRDVLLIAFSGEESGVLGSSHFVRAPPPGVELSKVAAMLNMDMVGRLRANTLTVLGADSAAEWNEVVLPVCEQARVRCTLGGDGYGPSDHTSFFAAGVPVLHFFTGAHREYHTPSDSPEIVNAGGLAQVAQIVAEVARAAASRVEPLTYRQAPAPMPRGDLRSFNASLGTVPDYAGPPSGQRGMLLAGVRPGGAADKAGMRRGDLLVGLGPHEIGSVEDLMYVLTASKPGERVQARILREGKELKLDVTYQESVRH